MEIFKKLNFILKNFLIKFIKFYQKYFSPDHSFWAKSLNKTPYCRFTPTCSNYMIEAIEKKGIFKGLILGIWRIMRCMPWNKGGYDPVDKIKRKNKEGEN